MRQCSPHKQPSRSCLGLTITWGIAAAWGDASVLMVGAGVGTGVGRISQSFLVSNRFSEADPVLGQGVCCLNGALGMSSSHGGPEFGVRGCPSSWGLAVG